MIKHNLEARGFMGDKNVEIKVPKLVKGGRTRALFNTGTRPHKSMKDYVRKSKHPKRDKENQDDN